jgi:hypothetical protein
MRLPAELLEPMQDRQQQVNNGLVEMMIVARLTAHGQQRPIQQRKTDRPASESR